ncbi:MAG: hypothetical protein RL193_19 [Actinomycetota bacterium]|jgi:uncharacterized protein with FMN-binding domain
MKRAMLIAGGTVGGLGVVLSVTPPELGSNSLSTLSGASAATSEIAPTENTADTQSTSQTAPTTTKENATSSSKQGLTTKKSTTSATTNSATSTELNSSSAGVTGSFTGDAVDIGYGLMQVKITVSNGKITEAVAVQTPDGRNQRWTDMAVPQLRSQTLAAQSAAISGVSGASYTAYGWYKSLITALEKAGMPTGV